MILLAVSLFSLFCFLIPSNAEPNLFLTPSVANAFVGDDVTFLCIKDDSSLEIAWIPISNVFLANNKNVTKLVTGVPDISFNNTEIQCIGRHPSNRSKLYFSNTGKIIIQDILSKICVNEFRKDFCTMQVSWVPPFTLPGVPILGYNVNITNMHNNITSNSFINNTSINITLGYDYHVSIAAVNGAGEGNETTIEVNSTELLNSTEGFNINIVSLKRDQNKWKVEANIDVTMICEKADASFLYKFCNDASCFNTRNITRTELSNSQALLSTSLFLPEDQHYDVQVEATFGRNVLLSFGTSLSTFDVQSVEETDSPAHGIICLVIHYVTGSAATGCQIKLDCDPNITFFHFDGYNDQFDKFQCTPELPLVGIKTCLLQVYDRVGQVNQNTSGSAVESTINVTGAIATTEIPTDCNCPGTKVAIAVVVPVSVIFMLLIIIVIVVFVKVQKRILCLNRIYFNRSNRVVTPENNKNRS